MKCESCEMDNDRARRFCGGCGATLGTACLRCSFRNEGTDRFCGGCGAALSCDAPDLHEGLSLALALRRASSRPPPSCSKMAPSRIEGLSRPLSQEDLDRLFKLT